MVLKRKRSESEFSTSSSLFSSPPSGMHNSSTNNQYTITPVPIPAQLSSRTRKRYRNNRPSEAEVHQHTLSMLFEAQQQREQPQRVFSLSEPLTPVSHNQSQPIQKSNLHSFWALPQKQKLEQDMYDAPAISIPLSTPSHCEDCNSTLGGSEENDAMDVDMMTMDVDERDFGCVSCVKQVCHSCAVSNLGADRKCLDCTKPRGTTRSIFGWGSNS